VAEAVNGVTTTYVVAVLGLSQVLVETTGGDTIRYLYGHDLLAEHDGSAWAYHLTDGLGSVRQLVDGNGNVTLAQGYTPFGVPLWSEGSGVTGYIIPVAKRSGTVSPGSGGRLTPRCSSCGRGTMSRERDALSLKTGRLAMTSFLRAFTSTSMPGTDRRNSPIPVAGKCRLGNVGPVRYALVEQRGPMSSACRCQPVHISSKDP
jgi:hypothetical protein